MEAFPRALEHVGSQVLSPCLRAVSHTWWEKHPSELAPATNKASAQLKMCTFAGRPEERKVRGLLHPSARLRAAGSRHGGAASPYSSWPGAPRSAESCASSNVLGNTASFGKRSVTSSSSASVIDHSSDSREWTS